VNGYLSQTFDLFDIAATQIAKTGYCILEDALPADVSRALELLLQEDAVQRFQQAGVGRALDYVQDQQIRKDHIAWIDNDTIDAQPWLNWTNDLMMYLNRRLFLGLCSFESHFSHYRKGDFYKKHQDAFKGKSNRKLSLVTYLNKHWQDSNGGELVIYTKDPSQPAIKVKPNFGTVVLFLSEEFPHEVLVSYTDRFSVAGWYRVSPT
jgi:SM-20-related protein